MSKHLQSIAYAALRMAAGLMFLPHGLQKLFGVLGGQQATLLSRTGAAGVIELVGGVCIALGLWTTPIALVASVEMACAYVIRHYPRGLWPIRNGGELAVLYCFIFLYVSSRGSGSFSLDALRRGGSRGRQP